MFKMPQFFRRRTEPTSRLTTDSVVLPRSVLEAITHNQGHKIRKAEILRLVRDGTDEPTVFANAALFSLFKAYESQPDTQGAILHTVAERLKNIPHNEHERARKVIRSIVEQFVQQLPGDQEADGAKLKRLNLAGFHTWDERYAREAARLARDPRPTFVVANSMIIGLSSLVRSFRESKKVLHILIPRNMPANKKGGEDLANGTRSNYPVGYSIHPDGSVKALERDFTRPSDAVVVDDIRREGRTERKIAHFWRRNGETQPAFEPLEVLETPSSSQTPSRTT